jgi:hypothetical protein
MLKNSKPTYGDLPMSQPCEQAENIAQLQILITDLTKEFRGLLSEMRQAFVEDREHKIRIQNLEKNAEIIFEKLRLTDVEREKLMEQKIEPLVVWKENLDGRLSALKIIPIICLIITTLVAAFTYFDYDRQLHAIEKAAKGSAKPNP